MTVEKGQCGHYDNFHRKFCPTIMPFKKNFHGLTIAGYLDIFSYSQCSYMLPIM